MYDVRPIDLTPQGIAECARLLSQVYADANHFTPGFLDWQYNQNPIGPAIGFNAYSEDEAVAHYVTLPVLARLFGRESRGVLSLNTATRSDHQGKKLFTTLASRTYERSREQGYGFVVGVANANSTPGFIGKLGFQLVSPLVAKVGFGRLPGLSVRSEPDFERVWTSESLAWRLHNPAREYSAAPDRHGRSSILAPTGRFGIQAIMGDFPAAELPAQLRAAPWTTRISPRLWMGLDSRRGRSGTLYFDIPRRLRPSPLNLIFRDLTGEGRTLSGGNVVFRAIDFDPY